MQLPSARRDGLVVEELADETLVYDLQTHKAHSLNPTAALVWRHCDGQTTVSEVARIVHQNLNAPNSNDLVLLAIERLKNANLMDPTSTGAHEGCANDRLASGARG